MRNRPKVPKPPARPTPAPGVPVPQAYTGPSRNLQAMAQSIGTNKALSEFYSALVREQWEYDNDYRQNAFDMQRDSARHQQEIDIQNNREWLKTGEVGRGIPSYVSVSEGDRESAIERVADMNRVSSGASSINAFESRNPGMGIDDVDSEKVDAELSKVKKSAELKAESDEAERDWWGNLTKGAGDIFDAVTPDAVVDNIAGGAKMVADSPVGEVVGNTGGWALKQLSRPSHAVASAADAFYGLNDDEIKSNTKDGSSLFGKSDNFLSAVGNMVLDNVSLFGASDAASLDDLDLEGIKEIGSAFKEGWNLDNDTTFSTVIKNNAERNPNYTVHDTLTYQTGAGIAGDVFLDPLNAVGVGMFTKPIKAAQLAKRTKEIKSFADDFASMNVPKIGPSKQGERFDYTADEVVEMLGGGRRYANKAERAADAKRIQSNVETLGRAIENAGPDVRRGQALRKAGERVRAQLDAEKARFASEVVTESAIKRTKRAEQVGEAPVGAAKALTRRIEQQRIVRAFGASKYGKEPEKFDEALGDAWKKHPGLTDKDRRELLADNRRLTKIAYPAESAKNSALLQRYTDMKKAYSDAKTPHTKAEYKDAMDRAKVALDRHNKKFNALRADTFMRSARARINKNLGVKSERQKQLLQIARASAKELHDMNVTPYAFNRVNRQGKKIKHGPEHQPDFENDKSYIGTAEDRITGEPNEGFAEPYLVDLPTALEPRLEEFGSRAQQMQSTHIAALNEYDSLYPEMVGADDLDKPLMDIPAEFETPFGDLDPTKIQEKLTLNEKALSVSVNDDVPAGPSRDWLEDFADAFNDEFGEEFSRLNQNAQRAANEEAQRKGEALVTGGDIAEKIAAGDEAAKKFSSIFRNPDGSPINLDDAAKKQAYPSFERKGKRIFQNSEELKADAPATQKHKKALRLFNNPDNWSDADVKYIYDLLKEFGLPVANHPESVYNYVKNNYTKWAALKENPADEFGRVDFDEVQLGTRGSLALLITPRNIKFAQEFKKAHGVALGDALELRASVLGNVIEAGKGYETTRWAKAYPRGISKPRFIDEVTAAGNGVALKHVLDSAPFRISPKADELGFPSPTTVAPMSSSGWRGMSDKEFDAALKKAGMPEDSTLADVEAQWYEDMHTYLNGLEPNKLRNKLSGIWDSSHKKQTTERTKRKAKEAVLHRNVEGAATRQQNIEQARDTAFDRVAMRIEQGKQVSRQGGSIYLPHSLDELDTAKSIVAAKREEFLDATDEAREALQEAKRVHDTPEIARLERRLNRLRVAYKAEKEAVRADLAKAREAKNVMQQRLREEAIINVANAELIAKSTGLAFNVLGKDLLIPGTRTMFAAAEKAGGLPVIKKFFDTYQKSFASQAALLPDEMLYIRNRAISDPSKNISMHIREIKETLGQVPLKARAAATRDFANGIDNETTRMIGKHMDRLLPYFQNKVPVGDGVLTTREINAYLPEEFRLRDREYTNPRQILTELMADKSGKIDLKRDPVEAIWTARIAVEQAMAKRAMTHALNETFGIRRGYKINRKNGQIISKKDGTPAAETIERLDKEGWKTVDSLGHTHYFPPDVAKDIGRLLEMFKPMNAGKVGKLFDEVTGIWKTSVTIYNVPGYYIRNGIGEIMSAWLAGVNSAKPYYKSAQVWRYNSKQTQDAEAARTLIQQSNPGVKIDGESPEAMASKHIVTLQNGTRLKASDLQAYYRDQGLSTGFINTEYRHHYNRFKEKLHSIPGVQKVSNANEGLREFNENYEDFYRMAHFIDKLSKAPKSMNNKAAAEWAAKSVRKYHFDYTDFTHAEKAVMLRIFPFYKWTRKALPLMSSMMFAKPGKMMVYPKVMEGISESLVNSDDLSPDEQHNGFMPNYYGIVPSSIADMWSYQVAGDTGPDAEGQQSYFRMSTPQMDSMNFASNPMMGGESLLNPIFKGIIEQGKGETIGMGLPVANDSDSVEEEDGRLINNRWSHLMNFFPLGAMATNIDRGDMDQDAWIRLLTGMGYREVSEDYRNMEKLRGEK